MYIIRVKVHLASNATMEGCITSDYSLCDRIKDAKWFTEAIKAHEFIKILKTKWKYSPNIYDIDFEIYEPDGNDLLNDLLEDEPDHDLFEEARRKDRFFKEAEIRTVELLDRCEKLGEQLERMDDLITEIRHYLEGAK